MEEGEEMEEEEMEEGEEMDHEEEESEEILNPAFNRFFN
jgi:hypothetical protein